nr:histone deacetylase 14 [Tanacetum cinerariifolium]
MGEFEGEVLCFVEVWKSGSPLNLAEDDLSLRNLKFVPKGEIDEVFGMKIHEELITNNIRNAPYYNAYLEMIAKRRIAAEKEGDIMANENVHAPAPTRSDDQILPFTAWVPIGKSNFILVLQKKQENPMFQIIVDILQNTNLFRAFTASASVPAIYLQQFWDTLMFEAKTRAYRFQLDEEWFILDANLLREALQISPVDQDHQFVSPPSDDAIMDFVNQLGYSGEIHFVSRMAVNNLHHNIHKRSGSPLNLAEDDLSLGNLKFVPKGEIDEVFRMKILEELITDNIRKAPYYNAYLEMVAKHERRIAAEKECGKKKMAPKADMPIKPGKVIKGRTVKSSLKLVDEPDEEQDQPEGEHEPQGVGEEYDLERAIHMSLESFQVHGQAHVGGVALREPVAEASRPFSVVEGKGKAIATEEQAAQSLLALHMPKRRNAETGADTDKVIIEDQAGSDPGKTLESRPLPDDDKMDEDQAGSDPRQSHMALAGPNPQPMDDDFMATVYPKNLDDTYTFEDRLFNGKSTEDDPGKQNVDVKVVSIVIVPIHQASTSVPPLFTPIIDMSPPNPADSPLPESFTAATTETTTTTLPLLPPPQQQSTTNTELVARVTALEKKFADFEQKSQTLDNATQNLRDCFRELLEADMKEILRQRMFKSGSYKSLHEHVSLYEALEASMEWENRDEYLAKKDMSPSNTREALSSSSKQQSAPYSEQPVKDVPVPDDVNISDSNDTDIARLPRIKTRPDWLKLLPKEDRPETLKPDWIIPLTDLPEAENNWADALAKSYKDPEENKLLSKTRDMRSFIKWFCKRIGKKKLSKYDLEGTTFKVVRAFHENSISLQIQMKECHRLLTDQVDLVNLEGHRLVPDVSKPLPLGGSPGQMLRENEVHKFSDGTLTRVLHKLDHMVKDFRLYQYNPGMEYRIWCEDDKKRSEEFMEVIERRLKIRRIFQSLESVVGGRFRDGDYITINITE